MPTKKELLYGLTKRQQVYYDAMTLKEREFASYIMMGKNQTEAASLMNPSKTKSSWQNTGRNWMRRPAVIEFLESLNVQRVRSGIMDRDEALRRLSTLARGSIADFMDFDTVTVMGSDGVEREQTVWSLKSSDDMDPEMVACIAELTSGAGGNRIKIHPSLLALKQLAEMQGWNSANKIDLTSSDGSMTPGLDVSKLSDGALGELMALVDEREEGESD